MRAVAAAAIALTVGACTPGQSSLGSDGMRPGVQRVVTCTVVAGKADRRCNPGETNPAVAQENISDTICVTGWTATVRPSSDYTNAVKRRQMWDYGYPGPASRYQEDHIIALSAGGHPTDPRNLFPQPRDYADRKDVDETKVHRDVCSGRISLAEGQRRLLAAWTH